jgi:Ca2+-binding EF-hand superfamily protein
MRSNSHLIKALLLALSLCAAWVPSANAGFYLREEARPLLVKADTNRDGYLSRTEICAEDPSLLTGFEQADVNDDGRLDLGEFEILLISL